MTTVTGTGPGPSLFLTLGNVAAAVCFLLSWSLELAGEDIQTGNNDKKD